MKLALPLLVAGYVLLHQDTWFWKNSTLVFGFLPIGLAYHIGYTLGASVLMAILVRYAWPGDLETKEGREA